jgi:hypothetical protein
MAIAGRCIPADGVARRLNSQLFALHAPGMPGASAISVFTVVTKSSTKSNFVDVACDVGKEAYHKQVFNQN